MSSHRVTGSAAELIQVISAEGVALSRPGQLKRGVVARPEQVVAHRVFQEAVDLSRLTLRQQAKRVGVSLRLFARWYHGERPVPYWVFLRLTPRQRSFGGDFLNRSANAEAIPATGTR